MTLKRWLGRVAALTTIWIALTAATAGTASALQVGFSGPGGFGFDNAGALPPAWRIPSAEDWLQAGSRELDAGGDFALLVDSQQTVLSGPGEDYSVEVEWQIENATDEIVEAAVLFFARLAGPADDPMFPAYPNDSVLLDDGAGSPFTIVEYQGSTSTFYFVGFAIENFAPGPAGSVTRSFRYLVDRPEAELPDNKTPAIGLGAAIQLESLPEPTPGVLLALALAGLAGRRTS